MTSATPRRGLARPPGLDAVCHQAARVGLGVDFADVRAYVDDNDAGTAAGLWALHQAGLPGRLVLASSMVVYGEGRYALSPSTETSTPDRRRADDLDAGRFDPPCPECGTDRWRWAPVTEDAPADPRNTYAATKLHQEHLLRDLRSRARRPGDGAAVPQRVRAPLPARHALRGGGVDLPLGGGPREPPSGAGGRRPDPRLRARPRRGARANVLALTAPEPYDGAAQRRLGLTPDRPRPGRGGVRGHRAPARGRRGEAASGDVRHIVASADAGPPRARLLGPPSPSPCDVVSRAAGAP